MTTSESKDNRNAAEPSTLSHHSCTVKQAQAAVSKDGSKLMPSTSGSVTNLPLLYDIYGDGPIKLVFLAGMSLSRSSWIYQIEYFASKPQYSCLTIENRGFDDYEAQIPLKGASTKQLARDMLAVLSELEWTKPKSIHIVGFSLGGMVALQMGRICPEYIASMHIVSGAQTFRRPLFKIQNYVDQIHVLCAKSDEEKGSHLLNLLLPAEYLYSHDPRFPDIKNNRARYLQQQSEENLFSKGQKKLNLYTQLLAFRRHAMSQEDLWEIAAKVRFIFISGADNDFLLNSECSRDLMVALNAQGRIYTGGHMIPWQHKEDLNADQEAMMTRAHREYTEYPPLDCLCLNDLAQTESIG